MSDDEYFKKYVQEILQLEQIDPLEYIYYRESIGFTQYLANQRLKDLFLTAMEPFVPLINKLEALLIKVKEKSYGNSGEDEKESQQKGSE